MIYFAWVIVGNLTLSCLCKGRLWLWYLCVEVDGCLCMWGKRLRNFSREGGGLVDRVFGRREGWEMRGFLGVWVLVLIFILMLMLIGWI